MSEKKEDNIAVNSSLARISERNGSKGRGPVVEVPVGIEKVLFLAARDEKLKARLLVDREGTLDELHIVLRPHEAAVLKSVTDAALDAMIASVVPSNPRRRRFMGMVATAAAAIAAGTVTHACNKTIGGGETMGVSPDDDIDGDDSSDDTESESDSDTGTDTETGS